MLVFFYAVLVHFCHDLGKTFELKNVSKTLDMHFPEGFLQTPTSQTNNILMEVLN